MEERGKEGTGGGGKKKREKGDERELMMAMSGRGNAVSIVR